MYVKGGKGRLLAAFSFMTKTVGRIKQGDLLLSGEILERDVPVKNGLVCNFPFDNTDIGINYKNNIIDDSTWVPGLTNSVGVFGANGDGNQVITFQNPWGEPSPVWVTLGNDSSSDADGGWDISGQPIDSTKKYRLTVWIRRENAGNGRIYFGCQGSTVYDLGTTTVDGNPYFYHALTSDCPEMVDNWVLMVGYIWPSTYTGGADSANGIYKLDGTHTRNAYADYKWVSGQTYGGHRTYLYYSTSTTERCYWYRPRMEVCDGTEPTIQELIMGMNNAMHLSNNVSTTLLTNGIAVEESTTNLLSSNVSTIADTNTWSCYDGYDSPYHTWGRHVDREWRPRGYNGLYNSLRVYTIGTGIDSLYGACVWDSISGQTDGTVLTVSAYIRGIKSGVGKTIVVERYSGNSSLGTQSSTTNYVLTNEWQKVTHTWTNRGGDTTTVYFLMSGSDFQFEFSQPQIETKAFATSWVNGTRGSNGNIQISPNLGSDWTLFYRFTPDIDWGDYYSVGYNRYMLYIYDKNTGKNIWLSDYHGDGAGQTTSIPWIGFDNFVTSSSGLMWHWHNITVDMQANQEHWFALSKSGSTWSKYLFSSNGLKSETITHGDATVNAISPNRIEFPTDFNCKIRDITIYNRGLSQDELLKLAKNSFSVTKQGNTKSKIIEKSNSIPSDAIYFPYGTNAYGANDTIKPSNESDTAYENGAIWVGSGYANLFRQATSSSDFSGVGNGTFVIRNLGDTVEYDYDYNQNTTWSYHGQSFATTNGTVYRASMDVLITDDANIPSTGTTWVGDLEGSLGGAFNYDNTKKGQWQRIELTSTSNGTGATLYLYPTTGTIFATVGHVKYKNVMVTNLGYIPPFVNGTRNYSHLNYSGASLTNNNWQEFSLFFWVKYLTTGAWRISGAWDRFYFGPNPSDVLNFAWVGYASSTDTTRAQHNVSGGTVPIGKWTHIGCSVKNANFIDLYINGQRTLNWTGAYQLNSGSMNFEWNSISPGDTSYPLNAYIKDAMFLRRAITDPNEVSTIYKNQMRAYKDNRLQVQGKIIEGKVF